MAAIGLSRESLIAAMAAPTCRAELAPLLFVRLVGKASAEQAPLYKEAAA